MASKKYGFVNGEDGESYFLHVSSLKDRSDESKLIKDVIVEFDPTPSPKGLTAKKVRVPTVYFKKKLVGFFSTRYNNPKHGAVEKRYSISSRFIKDFKESRAHFEKLAKGAGCNAILNLEFEKETFSSGNYKYAVHAFKGDFALVTESVPCDTQAQSQISLDDLQRQIAVFDAQFEKVHASEVEARAKQFESKCFIATSVYGDPCCYEVMVLRQFRDDCLLTTAYGRASVKCYYFLSPPIAEWLKSKPKLSKSIRCWLDKIVAQISK
jgi:cold shock CspA family protein